MKEVSRPSSDSSGSRSILSFNKPSFSFTHGRLQHLKLNYHHLQRGIQEYFQISRLKLSSQVSHFFLVNKLKFKVSLVLFMLFLTIEISLLIIERTSETEI